MIKVPELKLLVEEKPHDFDKRLDQIVIPNGARLLNPYELAFLFRSKEYCERLNMNDTFEFCYNQFDENHVCCFSSWGEECIWSSNNPHSKQSPYLGVRFGLEYIE